VKIDIHTFSERVETRYYSAETKMDDIRTGTMGWRIGW